MDNIITVKEAKRLLEHMNDDDIVVLSLFNEKTYIHSQSKRVKKVNGEYLIDLADTIEYQNNDFFGRLLLHGVTTDKYLIHNLMFPQRIDVSN